MRARQLLTGIGAMVVTLTIVAGVPWFLATTVGNPWPGRAAIDLRDRSAMLTGALALVAWVLWTRFVVALCVESVRQLATRRERAMRAVPRVDTRTLAGGDGATSRLAGALVAAVFALVPMLTRPAPVVARAPLPLRPPTAPQSVGVAPAHPPPTFLPDESASTITVARGDTLFALARAHLGDSARWREIFEINRDRLQADGGRLTSPSLIKPGWTLILPTSQEAGTRTHTVERGESYWEIATHDLVATSGREPTPAEVLAHTGQLMAANAPRLAHGEPALLLPGDAVVLDTAPADGPPAAAVAAPTPAAPPTATAEVPPPTAPSTRDTNTPPASTPQTTRTPTTTTSTTMSPPVPLATGGAEQPSRWPRGLSAAALLAAGAFGLVQSRRRAAMRAAPRGARLRPPTEREVRTEQEMAGASRAQMMARLDIAVRAAARLLAADRSRMIALTMAADGTIRLLPDRTCPPDGDLWRIDLESGWWILPASVDIAEIAAVARLVPFPSPALVALGRSAAGELYVDLEALGLLCIDAGAAGVDVARHLAASLAVSPFADGVSILTVGLEERAHLAQPNSAAADDLATGFRRAVAAASSTSTAVVPGDSTFAMRVGSGGETWDPAVLVCCGVDVDASLAEEIVACTAGGGHGLAVVLDRPLAGAPAVLRPDGERFLLEPLGLDVHLTGLTTAEVDDVGELLAAAGDPAVEEPIALESAAARAGEPYAEPEWALLVQTLGHVAVHSAGGERVAFDRSKALELVVWLSTHRDRPTRSAARTALWELDVRDNTFANVLSDARRAMARAVPPPDGEEWISRKLTDQLPLHDLVVGDADLLRSRLDAARGLPVHDAIEVLRPGLELVDGMPFADTTYLWVDAEGLASRLTLLVTTVATELAGLFLTVGDVEGVFWATHQGLKVLPGHEELISLRMRAHAERGDLAGVRSEWASYERVLSSDSWEGGEPSQKLVALRHRLLSPSITERAS